MKVPGEGSPSLGMLLTAGGCSLAAIAGILLCYIYDNTKWIVEGVGVQNNENLVHKILPSRGPTFAYPKDQTVMSWTLKIGNGIAGGLAPDWIGFRSQTGISDEHSAIGVGGAGGIWTGRKRATNTPPLVSGQVVQLSLHTIASDASKWTARISVGNELLYEGTINAHSKPLFGVLLDRVGEAVTLLEEEVQVENINENDM